MAQITFTIPDAKLQRVVTAIKNLHAIPETGGVPDYTDNQWAKEYLRRLVVSEVQKWETQVAASAVVVPADDSIIS